MEKRKRPMTRSRVPEASSSSSAVGEVAKLLTDLTKPERSRVSRQVSLSDQIRAKVESLSGAKYRIESEYVDTCRAALEQFLHELIRKLRIVSLHRAGLSSEERRGIKSTSLEEFLLFKEDCASYFQKVIAEDANAREPVFVKQDYAAHALEEEEKILLTSQSVRRINARDFLAILPTAKIPQCTAQKLTNKAALAELLADYTTRGSSAS